MPRPIFSAYLPLMQIRLFHSMSELDPKVWDALAPKDFPFLDHAFLSGLEAGQCVGKTTGWRAVYFTAWEDDVLQAAACVYEKHHSYGEYIFDWAWAEAAANVGLDYYPKWVLAVPFTPAPGPRLLFRVGLKEGLIAEFLRHLKQWCFKEHPTSLHALFIQANEVDLFRASGFFIRQTYQFHWHNEGFASFAEFLGKFSSKKRSNIVRERRSIVDQGIRVTCETAGELTAEKAKRMYGFYRATIEKKHASSYLSETFFIEIFKHFSHSIFLVSAFLRDACIGMAIFFRKGDGLFGRYWGAKMQVPNLHFELCYYQGIELAISKKLRFFSAGAQGPHKIARGFLPQVTLSAHVFHHPTFHSMVENATRIENHALDCALRDFSGRGPFKLAAAGEEGPEGKEVNEVDKVSEVNNE